MQIIARIHTDFASKFGVPRQSGLIDSLTATIVFEEPYRVAEAFRGLDDFSHIWILWQFSEAVRETWSPTVRPPMLGGNTRMGVFATRSPFRPNPIGLSCVELKAVEFIKDLGPVLHVAGADLMDGTPIYDIKPYLAYTDSRPDATGGFTNHILDRAVQVECPAELLQIIPADKQQALLDILASDPRPTYQNDPERVYGFGFAGYEIGFTVNKKTLTVVSVSKGD
ncbi:MAG: tRNA (N6-threonylcarbamoyladenosine(37)-N6)-methyltransferase TrmO [Clostridia bacterium]|nr:tRNA (N6-threonylcarbamoyladenosine(37)-N6)-methyltransferase TrmO [Clostridia bacterium]